MKSENPQTAASGKIAAHLALLAETALAEKQEALRVAAADLKDLKMRSEAEAEDLTTRLTHAEGALEETAEREKELKTRCPTPYTLYTTHYTLHPTPYTLHPTRGAGRTRA